MANQVQLTVANVRSTIANFQQRRAEFMATLNGIGADGFNLEGTWRGESSQKYMNKLRELLRNLKTIDADIDGAIEKMNKAIELYSTLEQTLAGTAHALDAGAGDYVS